MIFYVDPMSYNNLENYDNKLLENINETKLIFYGNKNIINKPSNAKLIYNYSSKKNIFKVFSYIFSQFILMKEIITKKPNLVHFQWFKLPYFDYIIIILLKSFKIKLIFTAHNILPHNTGNKYYKIYKMIYKKLDKIIVHADKTKKELNIKFNINTKRIEVIPHGILDIKNETTIDYKVYNKMHLNKIKISFLGNISIYKGIDYFINAWNSINTKINNIQLIIAGKGDLSKYEILSNKEHVLIDNRFLSDSEFYTYLKYSDIIVLPYREISQSGVLLTALSEKKLIIATDKGGLGEPYKLFNLGWLINNHDVARELKNIIIEIDSHPEIINYKTLDDKTWNNIYDYYSWIKIGKKTKEIYNKIINNII